MELEQAGQECSLLAGALERYALAVCDMHGLMGCHHQALEDAQLAGVEPLSDAMRQLEG
jgi:hypothetical protein